MPHYKVDRTLLFKRDELDNWLGEHRVEPRAEYEERAVRSERRLRPHRGALEKYGEAAGDRMTPTELIEAVQQLPAAGPFAGI